MISTMLSRNATSPALTSIASRVLPGAASAGARLGGPGASAAQQQTRGLATVQDAPAPKRIYGGLRDQDRIFQNLYSHHGPDLASAKKYGDWHKTKEILDKGHDWVCQSCSKVLSVCILMLYRLFPRSRLLVLEDVAVPASRQG